MIILHALMFFAGFARAFRASRLLAVLHLVQKGEIVKERGFRACYNEIMNDETAQKILGILAKMQEES